MAPTDERRNPSTGGRQTGPLARTSRSEVRERKLLRAARRGDHGARERIVGSHLDLVRGVAARYRNLGLPFDDLVQEGALGLLDALDRYDPARGSDFATFARFRVQRAILNALTEQSRLVRLPKHVVERRRALTRAETRLTAANGRAPTATELADATGLPVAAVQEAQAAALTPISLDELAATDGSKLVGLIADSAALDPERDALERDQALRVEAALAALPSRQRQVIRCAFGVGVPPQKIAAVAADLQLSTQRTRTIAHAALTDLRAALESV